MCSLVVPRAGDGGYSYSRGFVEYVCTRASDFLREAHQFFGSGPVRRVRLVSARDYLAEVGACRFLERLNELELEFWDMEDFRGPDPDKFRSLVMSPNLSRVRSFGTHGGHLGEPGVEALIASPLLGKLTNLSLSSF